MTLLSAGERPFRCTFCPKTFGRKECLKTHLVSYHSKQQGASPQRNAQPELELEVAPDAVVAPSPGDAELRPLAVFSAESVDALHESNGVGTPEAAHAQMDLELLGVV